MRDEITNAEGMPMPGAVPENRDPEFIDDQVYVSNSTTFFTNSQEAASQSSVENLLEAARNTINQADDSTPVLNKEEVEALKKGRTGITFPTGVRQRTADAIIDDFDAKQAREQILAHSQPTVLGKISGFAGNLVGTTLSDPLALIGGGLAGKLSKYIETAPWFVGAERAAIKNALSTRIGERIIKGAVEGFGFGAIQETAANIKAATDGDTLDAVQSAEQIADVMFLGGVLHPIGGLIADRFKEYGEIFDNSPTITDAGSDDAAQTALQMMNQGKDPDTQLALQNGIISKVKDLHDNLTNQGLNVPDALESLSDAKQTLENNQQTNNEAIANLVNKERTPEENNQLENLRRERTQLMQQDKAIDIYQNLLNNPSTELPKNAIDDFARKMNDTRSDFANGAGQNNLDVVGEPVENPRTLLQDRFDEETKKALTDENPLSSTERNELEKINNKNERQRRLREAIDATINCLSGGE